MAKKSLFSVLDNGPRTMSNTKASYDWFRTQVRKMVVPIERAQLMGKKEPIVPGGMYLFGYDPKTKAQLPYWDTQPLILCFNILPEHFYGINLHYLQPEERAIILRELMGTAAKNFPKTHEIKMNWSILNYFVKAKMLNHAVKQYRYDHMTIAPVKINADAWKMSIFLPTESFVGAARHVVWKGAR